MHQPYLDILSRLGKPAWWDENGVPRYEEFHPRLCADIYADLAALITIRCQGCSSTLSVSSTWGITDAISLGLEKVLVYRKKVKRETA